MYHFLLLHVQYDHKSHPFWVTDDNRLTVGVLVLWNTAHCVKHEESSGENPLCLVFLSVWIATVCTGCVLNQDWNID